LEISLEYENIIKDKTSKYNTDVYLNNCQICKSKEKLESHHIVWQKDFNVNNINTNKLTLQKNDASNIVILCQSCHDKVDNDEIKINGWKDTSNGRKFDYEINSIIMKKSKYTEEFKQYILGLKSIVHDNVKMAIIKIKEDYNIKVSSKSIINIWEKI
jgi:hypothetical protein